MNYNITMNTPGLDIGGMNSQFSMGMGSNGPGYPAGVPGAYPMPGPIMATPGTVYQTGSAYPSAPGIGYQTGGPPGMYPPGVQPPMNAFPLGTGPGAGFGVAGNNPMPVALPIFQGYIGGPQFEEVIQPPVNPYFKSDDNEPDFKREIPTSAAVTLEEAKEALDKFAENKCCAEKSDTYEVTEVQMRSAFKYNLRTFTEYRKTVWEFEPYMMQTLEGPTGVGVPGPWDVPVQPPTTFNSDKKKITVPNTSSIRPCHKCVGLGRTRCTHCNGLGMPPCTFCHGKGQSISGESCTSCNSSGRKECTWCHGQGFQNCELCKGKGQLFMYLQLVVEWKTEDGEFVSDSTAIPKKKLSKAQGIRALSEQHRSLSPLIGFPDEAIVTASKNLLQEHAQKLAGKAMILEQLQSVDIVRIAEVNYRSKVKEGTYYVYGTDNKVYFPEYPSKCCCVIL